MKDSQILRTQFRVADFVGWQRSGTLDLNPNFQRRAVWKKRAKSFLIDTILRGLPIPIIFLRDLPADLVTLKAKRDVVDGQQRLRTIFSFIDPQLLKDFKATQDEFTIDATQNEKLGGKTYACLEEADQRQILDYQFSVHVFPPDTGDKEILQIFARMNSTGVKLNAQELRNAEWYGAFKKSAYDLATEQLYRWRDWRIFNPDGIARMQEVELTSELMILIMTGLMDKKGKIDGFYSDYDDSLKYSAEVAHRFRRTFDTTEAALSKDVIARYFHTRTLFYALFATIYGLQFGLRSPTTKDGKYVYERLEREKARPITTRATDEIIKAGTRVANNTQLPPKVLKALRGASTDASQRKAVIQFLAGNEPWRPLS
jgi:hypothetical protein